MRQGLTWVYRTGVASDMTLSFCRSCRPGYGDEGKVCAGKAEQAPRKHWISAKGLPGNLRKDVPSGRAVGFCWGCGTEFQQKYF